MAKFPCILRHAAKVARHMPGGHADLDAMRKLRDEHLRRRPDGRGWITRYRITSEKLIATIDALPNAAAHYELILRELLDPLVPLSEVNPELAVDAGQTALERLERHYLRKKRARAWRWSQALIQPRKHKLPHVLDHVGGDLVSAFEGVPGDDEALALEHVLGPLGALKGQHSIAAAVGDEDRGPRVARRA
jgi:hypothetical protein